MEHIVKIGIPASTKAEAEKIVADMVRIKNALKAADHSALADLLEKNPGIIETAKKLLCK